MGTSYFPYALHYALSNPHPETVPAQEGSWQARDTRLLTTQALSNGTTPSSIYGGEHLLRLCYKLPDILPVNGMSAEDQLHLEMRLSSIVKFLQKNESLFFVSAGTAAPELKA